MNNETRQEAKNIIDDLLICEKISTQGVFEAVVNGSVDYQKKYSVLDNIIIFTLHKMIIMGYALLNTIVKALIKQAGSGEYLCSAFIIFMEEK